jgi:hypothetical protein
MQSELWGILIKDSNGSVFPVQREATAGPKADIYPTSRLLFEIPGFDIVI